MKLLIIKHYSNLKINAWIPAFAGMTSMLKMKFYINRSYTKLGKN